MRLRDIFTSQPKKDNLPPFHCIPDVGGYYFITEEYMKEGVENGWLIYSGYYRDLDNRLVFTYDFLNGGDCV